MERFQRQEVSRDASAKKLRRESELKVGLLENVPIHPELMVVGVYVYSVLPRNFNWGQCPSAFEKVGTFEKKVGTFWGKRWDSDLKVKINLQHY